MSKKKKTPRSAGQNRNVQSKKVVSTTSSKVVKTTAKGSNRTRTRSSKRNTSTAIYSENDMLFSKDNYLLMGAGIVLILIGFLLMSGGAMPDADTWDASEIYSFRRTVIAPVFVIAGLIVEIVAIFRDTDKKAVTE